MQFMVIASVNPERALTPPSAQFGEAESQAVRGLYMDGLIRQIWVRGDQSGAYMIVEAASSDEVVEKLSALPMVRDGFMLPPTVVPLEPYWGFGPRFQS
jgi:muconolactone delta-isomerase